MKPLSVRQTVVIAMPESSALRQSENTRLDFAALAFIALLMVLHALPYYFATVTLDTARDLAAALQIVQGQSLARGPILNGLFHLGPLWFYLLAPVLALTQSQAITLLWVGLLAALKFPLAYRFGKRLQDRSLGLCFAALLAVPGWSAMGSMFPTHTVMVEAGVLLMMLLMLKLARGGYARDWAWLGLAAGLAMHAHPTAVFALVLLPAVFWFRRSHFRFAELIPMLLGAALFLLPLLPMLLAESAEGWPALAPTLNFAAQQKQHVNLMSSISIIYGTLVAGPEVALGLGSFESASVGALSLLGLLAIAALSGWFLPRRQLARRFAWALLALVLVSLLLALLRDYTPFYMTLVLMPFAALLLAIGLRALPRPDAWATLVILPSIVGTIVLISSANAGHASINVARLANVQNAKTKIVDAALLPAWQLDALGQALCDSDTPVVLHGYLALLYDASLAIGPELRCGRRVAAEIAGPGSAGAQHWLGLPPTLALQLGLQQSGRWIDTPKTEVQALWPLHPVAAADRTHYPHHRASPAPGAAHTWEVRSGAGHLLITTDLLYPYRVNRIDRVVANGQPARKWLSANVTAVWICDHCGENAITWKVIGEGNDPDTLDIVAVALPDSSLVALRGR
jgi:4-amino-4-deoxy-L-arabinose transferase-like glycosyltransferase